MKGWFDAFRTEGGPTLYSYANRTPVTEDVQSIVIYLAFITLFVAFLIVFPGIRKERLTTFLSVTLSLFVGAVILLCNYGSGWHVAQAKITAPYKAFSREKVLAQIGVYIGLNSVNITLKALPESNHSGDINYNERFYWIEATQFKEGYREALQKGLPFPILTVAEYLSLDEEGFCWGGKYRTAGYYSHILLWTAFAIWVVTNIMFCVVPRYGAYTLVVTGILQLLTNIVYNGNLPTPSMVVPFEGGTLRFRFGWCFWLIVATGLLCVVFGAVIAILDFIYPHKFSTVLEVDYDTPFDRHIILQDHTKMKGANRNSIEEIDNDDKEIKANKRRKELRDGIDNQGFEGDQPKKSWRFHNTPEDPNNQTHNRRQQAADVNIEVQSAAMW